VEYASDPYRANTFRRALAALVTARSPGFTDLRALTALVAVTHSRAWCCTTVARFRQDHAGRPRLASLLSSTLQATTPLRRRRSSLCRRAGVPRGGACPVHCPHILPQDRLQQSRQTPLLFRAALLIGLNRLAGAYGRRQPPFLREPAPPPLRTHRQPRRAGSGPRRVRRTRNLSVSTGRTPLTCHATPEDRQTQQHRSKQGNPPADTNRRSST
jgi:hypothetical protein